MSSKLNEFIASLVDATVPEHQQSYLLNVTGTGDPDELIIINSDNCTNRNYTVCNGHNTGCTNYGEACIIGTNTGTCFNLKNDPEPVLP